MLRFETHGFFACICKTNWGSPKTLLTLLNGRLGISPEMALRLSKVFGRSPEGWLKLQLQYDLWVAEQNTDLKNLKPIKAA